MIGQHSKLTTMQSIELGILKELDRICRENDIKYFIIAGTMLGAIRHKGFVPWDDDIDLGLLREDYDRLMEIAEKELKAPFALHTYKNCPEHHYYFAHAVDTRYQVMRTGSSDQRIEDVWVDIYPFDGLPANPVQRLFHCFVLLFDRFMYHMAFFDKINIARSDRPPLQKAMLTAASHVQRFIKPDKNTWRNRMDRRLRRYPAAACKMVINFISVYLMKEVYEKKLFDELVDYQFEDMRVPGPRNYDSYLSHMYGDYMTPISEDERVSHPMEVLFEEEHAEQRITGMRLNVTGRRV